MTKIIDEVRGEGGVCVYVCVFFSVLVACHSRSLLSLFSLSQHSFIRYFVFVDIEKLNFIWEKKLSVVQVCARGRLVSR